ncbi:transposase [Streptomyces griseorubiginosus]|uniref:transposase n=1 Tax=Streptomyces griseorubiginosus TaxID=67304 RepID=UPI0031FC4183
MGHDSAAALLITAGDRERLASEASFAAPCGVSPVEKSSGKATVGSIAAETGRPTPHCTASWSRA